MTKAIYDNLLLLKDAGAVTTAGAATVASVARVIDAGAGAFEGQMVIDTSAIDTVTGDETYRVALQGCAVVGFGSGVVELASAVVDTVGRRQVPFTNESVIGTYYRYLRAYITPAGTTPSINSSVFLTK